MQDNSNNVAICYPNQVGMATLTGGSYTSQLPLTNAKNRVIKRRARSTDLDLSSTQFEAEWNRFAPIGVVALAGHNFSVTAQVRIKIFDNSTNLLLQYDSGWVAVWPALFQSDELEWEFDNFWLGTISEEDRELFTPLFVHFVDLEAPVVSQYMTVEIDDQNNSQGYVEFGRLFFGDIWQPTRNANLGLSFQYSTSTEIETALDDTEYFDVRTPRRSVQFVIDRIGTDEAFGKGFDMQRRLGVDGEVLFAYTKSDELYSYERRFLGRLSQLDAISEPYVDRKHSVPLNILEII